MNNKIISSVLSLGVGLGSYYYYNNIINKKYKIILCSSENDNYDDVLRYIYICLLLISTDSFTYFYGKFYI